MASLKAHDTKRRDNPCYKKFLDYMLSLGSLKTRHMIVTLLDLSSYDPDGLWSDLDDMYEFRGKFTMDDIIQLCRLYNAAILEQKGK